MQRPMGYPLRVLSTPPSQDMLTSDLKSKIDQI